jgi:hypothetical protein
MFPNNEDTTLMWSGIVDRMEGEIGWGECDGTHKSFDIALPQGYGVGTRVEFYDIHEREGDGEYMIALIREDRCSIQTAVEEVEGFEVIHSEEFFKDSN